MKNYWYNLNLVLLTKDSKFKLPWARTTVISVLDWREVWLYILSLV